MNMHYTKERKIVVSSILLVLPESLNIRQTFIKMGLFELFRIILIVATVQHSYSLPTLASDPCPEPPNPPSHTATVAVAAETLPFEPTNLDLDQKIIGGQNSSPGEFPYIVSIQVSQSGSFLPRYRQYCDGSIINSEWIMTAAHCCGLPFTKYKIVAGGYDQAKLSGREQESYVIRAIRHPDYNEQTISNDICVMRLAKELVFVPGSVEPIEIRKEDTPEEGNAITAGWGITSNNATTTPSILQKIILPLVPCTKCEEIYSEINSIDEGMICAGFDEGKNVCHGDSGGPLLAPGGGYQIGIVSWGVGCAYEGFPGVFTNVAYFAEWVKCVTSNSFMCSALSALSG